MRVISGSARGRRLKGPPSHGTRPMADKIREALFSVLASLGVEADRVLDLYAGTGSIGIEALSRGASWCDFVEQNAAAARVVRENLASVGFADRGNVHQMSVMAFLRTVSQPYDLVILDPPYAAPDILETLEATGCSGAVTDGTIIAIGHSPRVDLPERVGTLVKLRGRCHGDSCFAVYDVVLSDARSSM
ncbi:MAG: 16S rRNA (guanine(966)-N(2))-methyltransferase RsmD [Chloroflexi bacterium]|nr:MAG: 16S rRNA (guanine(966)-N(2))-methyltransferase RsmD [Chloroflexota bacterium]